ncbi:carbohydrate-binding family 9-like protein [Daejeonella sp. JGW-45]|uniref:carbohydrate-binding family 9-like protein n=1 Tax=Daejeonella sp. JGW-45 TaxID=3034148 RepID=UPI0023EC7D22|nr:carbohydrate-binding family 9-like protein [Daejeonella sp. JGW-45]
MKKTSLLLLLACVFMIPGAHSSEKPAMYKVKKLQGSMKIDASWNKAQWKKVKEIPIENFMGQIPAFQPRVVAKMMYDSRNIYMIYKVEDRHVRIQNTKFNSPVSTDACVEFFFAPDKDWPLRYFNIEINAGGTALMAYHKDGKRTNVTEADFNVAEVAHTLPKKLDQEISEPVTWFLEFKMPLSLLAKYGNYTQPEKGVKWKANFYKTSSRSTNPHYITWSVVQNPVPQFHLPQYFGTLMFK